MNEHVLVVDDDRRLRKLLRNYLTENGFRITEVSRAAEAKDLLRLIRFDLMVLDVMMPGETGLQLAEWLRSQPTTARLPVLFLTAMGSVDDRVNGLQSGGDDYMSKPFDPRELVLRLRNIRGRSPQPEPEEASHLVIGPFRYDPVRRLLERNNFPVHLTEVELALLDRLAQEPGQPVSRELLAECSGGDGRSVDVQIGRLRRKIEDDPAKPVHVQTVRGSGYRLCITS